MPFHGREPDAARASPGDPNVLISLVASAATGFLVIGVHGAWLEASAAPAAFAAFLLMTIALQLVSVEVYGRGATSFASVALLALGFTFGPGAAMTTAVVMGLVNLVVRRGRLNRGVFDAAQLALAAGAGAAAFELLDVSQWTPLLRVLPAVAAAAVYMIVNVGLLCLAMSLADPHQSPRDVWKERFRWLTPYYLASGPLALALTIANEKTGIIGMLAFALPPALMMFSVRQYISRTKDSVEDVRRANEDLRVANADLQDLFDFAGGLASRSHDRAALVAYAEQSIGRLTGARVRLGVGDSSAGTDLVAGGTRVGGILFDTSGGFDSSRWDRLSEAILPQLATALESAELVDKVKKMHVSTIAALSRSMEAKDYYTGGHTERVSSVAVALAERLGYTGADLDAIEIGALLHDIGKIGIPERILQKPGPLDEEEWRVMKEHPVISEYILADVDLPEIVLQIARSSHERMDGAGYPDGLVGERIPMPARIVLVADAFDALTSDRPYRRGRPVRAAIEELRAHSATQFCPQVLDALEELYRDDPQVLGGTGLHAVTGIAS